MTRLTTDLPRGRLPMGSDLSATKTNLDFIKSTLLHNREKKIV